MFCYLDILFRYPTFPIDDAYLFAEYLHGDKAQLLCYTALEAKLCSLDEDFCYYMEEFEEIVGNEKLQKLGLTDVIVNGIVNTFLPK